MNIDDFIAKTNIKELVQKEYEKLKKDDNAVISSAVMDKKLEFYYEYRKRTHEWHLTSIKNLRFKDCECTRKSNEANDAQDKENTLVRKPDERLLNEFQREIMALNHEAFVNETNIKDIVWQDFRNQCKDATEISTEAMEFGLNHYEKLRKKPWHWHDTSMVNLKFKVCECKRKKQFQEESVNTDAVETQFCAANFENNKTSEPDQQQMHLVENNHRTIQESRMICNANFSSEAFETNSEQETNGQGDIYFEIHKGHRVSSVLSINLFNEKYIFNRK